MNFLIVDDDRMICNGTARRLRSIQLPEIGEVVCAYSGAEALALLRSDRFQVLFTDIRMDDMDGLQLVEAARRLHPNLVCVIITAFDQFQYAQKAIRLGVFDFLVKPCSERTMQEQAIAAARHAQTLQERLRSSLDLALGMQIIRGEKTVDECFHDHDLPLPTGPIRMAVFHGDMPAAPWPVDWHYIPANRQFILFRASGPAWQEALASFCQTYSMFLGVSAPGRKLREMHDEAAAALRFAWLRKEPHAVCYVPQELHGLEEARARLQQSLQGGNIPEELSGLDGPPEPRQMELCTLLMEAAFEACGIQRTLEPGMGSGSALELVRSHLAASDSDRLIRQAKAYAQAHLHDQIDMATVANHMNLSYSYFSRVFHESTGKTFSRFLLEMRMQEACRLLLSGERLVDIAIRLGYQNANNLTRSFTREFGMSPSQWLKKQQKGSPKQ